MKYRISITEIREEEIEADSQEEAIQKLIKLRDYKAPKIHNIEGESDPKILDPKRNDLTDLKNWTKVKG